MINYFIYTSLARLYVLFFASPVNFMCINDDKNNNNPSCKKCAILLLDWSRIQSLEIAHRSWHQFFPKTFSNHSDHVLYPVILFQIFQTLIESNRSKLKHFLLTKGILGFIYNVKSLLQLVRTTVLMVKYLWLWGTKIVTFSELLFILLLLLYHFILFSYKN